MSDDLGPNLHPMLTDGPVERDFGFGSVRRWCPAMSDPDTCLMAHQQVLDSWKPGITFRAEVPPFDGLRRAQLGAIHAVLAHWSTGTADPATVVMPTGTGKTETMLALLVEARLSRLLVLVPSDALRSQLAEKFEQLGRLGDLSVLPPGALRPAVGRLTGRLGKIEAVEQFIEASQVIVTTPHALAGSSEPAKLLLYSSCDALFIDEAHHVRAKTWGEIRSAFIGKRVVQFTATPFREDGQHIQGRFVYVFPLREAQKDRVYSHIRYESVFDLLDPDTAIATRAGELLLEDLAAGYDHILMARCGSKTEANRVHQIYRKRFPDLGPVVMHSGMTATRLGNAMKEVRARRSRIVVCVDMLGEGFDLPQLKIAAIHHPRLSLAPTLQFAGRFARVAPGTGDACVITSRTERLFDTRLSRLYGEDSDWNAVVAELSEAAILDQERVSEFDDNFGATGAKVATRGISPKMSTVVFRTDCSDWTPEGVLSLFPAEDIVTVPLAINRVDRVMWFVVRSRGVVPWTEGPGIENVLYSLYVVFWDEEQRLLFINHSANEGVNTDVACAVAGKSCQLIRGDDVFRALGDIDRPIPTNVGVLDIYSKARRFSMHAGADVTDGFPASEEATKVQTNLFATGFREGERTTVGVSLKGRIWSYQVAHTLFEWVEWCKELGRRLLNESLDIQEIKRNFIRPVVLDAWPDEVILAAEWPSELLYNPPASLSVKINGHEVPISEVDLLVAPKLTSDGHIELTVRSGLESAVFAIVLDGSGMRVEVSTGSVEFSTVRQVTPGADFLTQNCPIILLGGDGLVMPPGVLFRPMRVIEAMDRSELQSLIWRGQLNRESRGPEKRADTVQGRALDWLREREWDFVIDDDGSGEVADLVALNTDGHTLHMTLVHCKFAKGGTVGSRVDDLYELCGQAQRSAAWRRHPESMLNRLLKRERSRVEKGRPSGFETGSPQDLMRLVGELRGLRVEMEVVLAQPGLSRKRASSAQLELLAATQVYVRETSAGRVTVLTSE